MWKKKSGAEDLHSFHIYDSLEVQEGIHLYSNYMYFFFLYISVSVCVCDVSL